MNIKKLNNEFELTLHRPNKRIIGELTMLVDNVVISPKIDDINTLSFDISRDIIDRFTHIEGENPMYDEVKEERLICLNNEEYYVIKSINEPDNESIKKSVSCSSLEHKLMRISLFLENVGLVIFKEDIGEEDPESQVKIMSLEELIENETGWKVNHVDDTIRYEDMDGEKRSKFRWQENVNMSWYSFLTEDFSDAFLCLVKFDTLKKEINIYDINTYGENIQLYLCKDNYIKSLERQTYSNDIVTRLKLIGKDEIDIRSVNPTGTDYVEDYSYFIDNGDMSDELIAALNKHDEILRDNYVLWNELSSNKILNQKELIKLYEEQKRICAEIKQLEGLKKQYEDLNDEINYDYIDNQIKEKNIEKSKYEQIIRDIEIELDKINNTILELNKNLDRKVAIDENGNKIFSKELLDELNEFLYYDSYTNNSFLTPNSLIEGGRNELNKRCYPTFEYDIDVHDFIGRIINYKSRVFKGDLNLGDLIIFYDENLKKEFYLYLVGYDYNFSSNNLKLYISNKKSKINNTKSISNKLRDISNMYNYINSKQYMLNQIKYNK